MSDQNAREAAATPDAGQAGLEQVPHAELLEKALPDHGLPRTTVLGDATPIQQVHSDPAKISLTGDGIAQAEQFLANTDMSLEARKVDINPSVPERPSVHD